MSAMDGPLKQHIELADAKGEDLTIGVWQEFFEWQSRLLPFRRAKFVSEASALCSGSVTSFANATYKEYIVGMRVLTKCICLFLIFTMLGRGTVFPLIEPTSPFMEQVNLLQPNHRRLLNIGA